MDELKSALAKQKIELDHLKVGKFYDAAHAESAHFDPEVDTAAFVLAGDAMTLSHAIQGIMRVRGFLNEAMNQQIISVVQKDLKAKMQGKCPQFTSSVIHSWCLKHEVKAMKTGIVMAAFQDIISKIEALALSSHSERMQSIIKHAEGFKEKVVLHATWAAEKRLEETDAILWQFAKAYYERFQVPDSF